MLRCETRNFGVVEFDGSTLIAFPRGLPGFESERLFVPIEREASHPVVFLHSLVTPALCFLTLSVESIDPCYELRITEEDLRILGKQEDDTASLRRLAIVCMGQDRPTANLLGPVLINTATGQAVQAIRDDLKYSAHHPLFSEAEAHQCS